MEEIRPELDRCILPGYNADLGVVIPALDEAETLPALLADLRPLALDVRCLVVDGGSRDGTPEVAWAHGADVFFGRTGRALQMNAGARFLRTRWLLFIHADSRINRPALECIEDHVHLDREGAAHFGFRLEHRHALYRMIEGGQRLRERTVSLIYGDQGLLIRRDLFFGIGPYPDVPLLEDVILNRWLAREGLLKRLPGVLSTSARRYEQDGPVTRWIRNVALITGLFAGKSPAALDAGYVSNHRAGERTASPQSVRLLVFAKAPRAGLVKTRLARTVGEGRATALYRRMGLAVVSNVAGAPARLTVCYDPADSLVEVREWLGHAVSEYWPQGDGDLGARLSRSVEQAFRSVDRVVVIGADAPDVDAELIARAVAALASAHVVLGPTPDGGYYLIALREPRPELFMDIPWSTPRVLEVTVARARARGLCVGFLDPKSDIDTAQDLTPGVLRSMGAAGR